RSTSMAPTSTPVAVDRSWTTQAQAAAPSTGRCAGQWVSHTVAVSATIDDQYGAPTSMAAPAASTASARTSKSAASTIAPIIAPECGLTIGIAAGAARTTAVAREVCSDEIGRASCRERGESSVVAGSVDEREEQSAEQGER